MDSEAELVYKENLEYLSSLEDLTDDLQLELDNGKCTCYVVQSSSFALKKKKAP